MLNTNDVYNDAVRGSRIHTKNNSSFRKLLMGSNVLGILLLSGMAYGGFNYYGGTSTFDKTLVTKSELIAELQIESESQVVSKSDNSDIEYLSALRGIESELTEEREVASLDTTEQMQLSSAMTDIMDDELLADNSKYTNALRKEIGVEVKKTEKSFSSVINDSDDVMPTAKKEIDLSLAMSELMDDTEKAIEVKKDTRVVVVKKGDTLQGISNKFYGDAMNYKRIIASNDSLKYNETIYEGQTILLPY